MSIVLLVEDDEAHRELIARAFEHANDGSVLKPCVALRDAEEYLSRVPVEHLTAVIMDWHLPDGYGIDLLRRLTLDVPVLMMTSFGNETLAVEAMKAGAMDYIVKSPEEFRRMPTIVQRIHREWTNIQQRKRFEQALRSREAQLRALINNTQEPIWSLDTAYCLLAFNDAFTRLVYLQTHETPLVGANVLEYFPEEGHNNRSLWQERYDTVLRQNSQMIVEHQDTIEHREVVVEIALNPIISSTGETTGIVVFTRDISERKRTERILREREERLHLALQEKNRLLEELEQQKRHTLQAVVEGQEHERSRIAKDLHDGVGQMLSVVKIGVSGVQEQLTATIAATELPHATTVAIANQLRESIKLLDNAVQEVRMVSHQLMPVALKQLGLSLFTKIIW